VKLPLWLQVGANLLSLVLALLLGWPPAMVLLLYWAENVVVAFWQVPRILLARGDHGLVPASLVQGAFRRMNGLPPDVAEELGRQASAAINRQLPRLSNLFVALFFLVHYGLFTFVHGQFVFHLFLHQAMTPENLTNLLGTPGIALALLGMMISHGMAFFEDLGSGRLATANPGKVMTEPYPRIIVLHLVVLGSGLLLTFLPLPQIGVVLLVLIKTFMDIRQATRPLPGWVGTQPVD
jgi:hypothetical protein